MRKGVRSCTHYPISNFVAYDHLSSSVQAFVVNISGVDIPKNIQEAWRDPKWKMAIIEEMQALEKNETWDIVAKPEGKTLKGCVDLYS